MKLHTGGRLVLIVYCLLLVYSCTWIPWHGHAAYGKPGYSRLGYGWAWAGPTPPDVATGIASLTDIESVQASAANLIDAGLQPASTPQSRKWQLESESAVPDTTLIELRLLALTAAAMALLVVFIRPAQAR